MSSEMERINTRVSKEQSEFLEKESIRKGISKSQLIMMAVEKYMCDSIEMRLRLKAFELEEK